MKDEKVISLQAVLIRQMQAKEGRTPCFASPVSGECDDKNCCWRHDCFDEALDMQLQNKAG